MNMTFFFADFLINLPVGSLLGLLACSPFRTLVRSVLVSSIVLSTLVRSEFVSTLVLLAGSEMKVTRATYGAADGAVKISSKRYCFLIH